MVPGFQGRLRADPSSAAGSSGENKHHTLQGFSIGCGKVGETKSWLVYSSQLFLLQALSSTLVLSALHTRPMWLSVVYTLNEQI